MSVNNNYRYQLVSHDYDGQVELHDLQDNTLIKRKAQKIVCNLPFLSQLPLSHAVIIAYVAGQFSENPS